MALLAAEAVLLVLLLALVVEGFAVGAAAAIRRVGIIVVDTDVEEVFFVCGSDVCALSF